MTLIGIISPTIAIFGAFASSEHDPALAAPTERVTRPLTGEVVGPGGHVAGAVVVTSAGGTIATDAHGRFVLDVSVSKEVSRIEVSIFAMIDGASFANRRTASIERSGATDLGVVELKSAPNCDAHWLPTFGGLPGLTGLVHALAVYDDGSGPAIFAAGSFAVAGGVAASHVAKWDGETWSPLGTGVTGVVSALAVYDDGSGPALYAGGCFYIVEPTWTDHFIARWDGTNWSSVGGGTLGIGSYGGAVRALAVYDDGAGPALFAGGTFTSAGGVPASKVARWDGTNWSALGSGVDAAVLALGVHDDGSGPSLYAGGEFATAGGNAASRIAKWDGTIWSPLGSGVSGTVRSMIPFDAGSGTSLFVGGLFTSAGGAAAMYVAEWDGASWSEVGGGANKEILSLGVFDLGQGAALFAGGEFSTIGGISTRGIASWNGSNWSPLGSSVDGGVLALAAIDFGAGLELFAGGGFEFVGEIASNNLARWNGTAWSALTSGINDVIYALAVYDDGTGPALYAGGSFTSAGGVLANHVAKWNGTTWVPLGSGTDSHVASLAVYNDGTGLALYAGGYFGVAGGVPAYGIAKWDGATWSAVGAFPGGNVTRLVVYNDGSGPVLVAAHGSISRWNGSNWSGVGFGTNNVQSLVVHNVGSGTALYAGGMFTTIGGVTVNRIARWNGGNWSPVGGGVAGGSITQVLALEVHDDGTGPALYAGGDFTTAGGVVVNNIAKWDGAAWSALSTGIGGIYDQVHALKSFIDDGGPALVAGGTFDVAGGLAVSNVAKWQSGAWLPLGSGTSDSVRAFAVHHAGGYAALYAGGPFWLQYDSHDSRLARWGGGCIESLVGCFGNPVSLITLSTTAKLGTPFGLLLRSQAHATGNGWLFAGLDGSDGAGCGVIAPGVGEVLLSLAVPTPLLVAQVQVVNHLGLVQLVLPAIPSLAGLTVTFQGFVGFGLVPKASNGLNVTLTD